MDLIVILTLSGAFGLLVTAHAVLSVSLMFRKPPWRGVVAFLVPPFAPYWGMEERMRFRSGVWLAALVVYIAARIAAEL